MGLENAKAPSAIGRRSSRATPYVTLPLTPTLRGGVDCRLSRARRESICDASRTWKFYNNRDFDHTAALKVSWYQKIAAVTGSEKLLVGAPVAAGATAEGYITLPDMIQDVIEPLQSNFGIQFGGMMGWQFASDQGGAWGNGIAAALDVPLACSAQSYTVLAGDSLFAIAQRFLGTGELWVDLTKPDGTRFTEVDAENLIIGQVVCIPG